MKAKALIYCRVSSQRQVVEGHGLDSQEKLCLDHARSAGYEIAQVFKEEGVSGGLFDRPEMKKLIQYMDEHPEDSFVIVFDDLKRFARDTEVHFLLKKEIYGRNGRVESPNFRFEDTPEGKFVETMMAATAELERNQNKRQVIQKMKARLESGYWPFHPPPALIHIKDTIHGKFLIANEPIASIYKKAIEDFANGILASKEEFRRYVQIQLDKHGVKIKLGNHGAEDILKQILYAGFIEHKKWGVERRKGHHKGFISLEIYELVQQRLQLRAKPRKRADYNFEFPLRPYVFCESCQKPLTASFNTGRNKRYPNYWCKTKGCQYNNRSIRREKIEDEFKSLLETVKPPSEVLDLAGSVLSEVWDSKKEQAGSLQAYTQKQIDESGIKIQNYVNRLGRTQDTEIISVYEDEIKKTKQNIKEMELNLNHNYTDQNFGTAYSLVFDTLKEPLKMWNSESYKDKQTILFMYFEQPLRYNYEDGFGTAQLARPIELINGFVSEQNPNVEMEGVEPSSRNELQTYLQACAIDIFLSNTSSKAKSDSVCFGHCLTLMLTSD